MDELRPHSPNLSLSLVSRRVSKEPCSGRIERVFSLLSCGGYQRRELMPGWAAAGAGMFGLLRGTV